MPDPFVVPQSEVPGHPSQGRPNSARQAIVNNYVTEYGHLIRELEPGEAYAFPFDTNDHEDFRFTTPTREAAKDTCRRIFRRALVANGLADFVKVRYTIPLETMPDGSVLCRGFTAFVQPRGDGDDDNVTKD